MKPLWWHCPGQCLKAVDYFILSVYLSSTQNLGCGVQDEATLLRSLTYISRREERIKAYIVCSVLNTRNGST